MTDIFIILLSVFLVIILLFVARIIGVNTLKRRIKVKDAYAVDISRSDGIVVIILDKKDNEVEVLVESANGQKTYHSISYEILYDMFTRNGYFKL